MRLLVTRPLDDANALAAILREAGHKPLIAPLMDVRFHDGPMLALHGVQAILATSANGVRALVRRSEIRDIPLYAVGPQTAEAAENAGFSSVVSGGGDTTTLVDVVANLAAPSQGTLFHAAGAETAGRLAQGLQARGFTVESQILYEAVPFSVLPEPAAKAITELSLDAVLLFSPRSAKTFATLVTEAGLSEPCSRLTAFCISVATASGLGSLQLANIAVAGEPNLEGMLALLAPQ